MLIGQLISRKKGKFKEKFTHRNSSLLSPLLGFFLELVFDGFLTCKRRVSPR